MFEALPADRFAGKVVLDQTNYYPGIGNFRRVDLDKGEVASSELALEQFLFDQMIPSDREML